MQVLSRLETREFSSLESITAPYFPRRGSWAISPRGEKVDSESPSAPKNTKVF